MKKTEIQSSGIMHGRNEVEGSQERSLQFPSISKVHEKNFNVNGKLPLMTIYDYIYVNNQFYKSNIAFNYLGAKISYGKLFDNIDKVTKALSNYGVKKGDFVTVMMPTQPETFYLLYALSRLGAIANLVDPRYPADYLEHAINRVDSKLVLATTVTNDVLANAKNNTSCEELIMVSPSLSVDLKAILSNPKLLLNARNMKVSDFAKSCTNWQQFIRDGKSEGKVQLPDYEENRTVVTIGTGGTTGIPKLVELTNDNINGAVFQCMNANFDFRRKDNWYDIMPPFIAFGVVDGLHLPLSKGMQVILEPQPTVDNLIKVLQSKKNPVNHMACGPNFYTELIHREEASELDLSVLYSPILGGKNINVNHEVMVNQILADDNCPSKIRVGWGLTECGGAASAPGVDNFAKPQSAGLTLPLEVVSTFKEVTLSDGTVSYEELPYVPSELALNVPEEMTGELCISGPNVMKGYYENEEETSKTLIEHNGYTWLHTGDIGYVTDDGVVYIIGRSKEFVARSTGFKTPPKEVEDIILLDSAIDDVKVVGYDNPDIDNDQLLKVYYTIKPGNDVSLVEDRLRLLCEAKLPEFKWPSAFECLDSMPLTPVAKIDIKYLQEDANRKALEAHKSLVLK